MSRLTVVFSSLLLLVALAVAGPVTYQVAPLEFDDAGAAWSSSASGIPWTGSFDAVSTLNEIIGDTMIVGTSWWDQQHNGQVGRMIGYFPGNETDPASVYIVYTKLYSEAISSARHVQFVRLDDDGEGWFEIAQSGDAELGYRSGYATIAVDSENNRAFPIFHYNSTSGAGTQSIVAVESEFISGYFDIYAAPEFGSRPHIWPHGAFGPDQLIHVISHDQRSGNTDPMEITYMRWLYDPAESSLADADGQNVQRLITAGAMNISGEIATSADGEQVAISLVMSRLATIGEDVGASQWNNDLWIFLSEDAGATWDLDNPIEVTAHIGPDISHYPDTVRAMGDTLRPYTDSSVLFDSDNRLHAAFTSAIYDALNNTRYYASRLFHWMPDVEGNPIYTQIDEKSVFDVGQAEGWGSLIDRPSLYFDDDTGILWCMYRKFSSEPDTNDYGAGGIKANGDMYISASPPGEFNGLKWVKGVNITNTIWTEDGGAPVGMSRNEIDPSISLNCDGDYLHMLYMVDRDPGTAISSTPEGTPTENPMVYHRIAKQDLLDIFEERAEWQVNYPMIVDGTGFWVDPDDWVWNGFFGGASVGETGSLQPHQVDLSQNYPNPFNPSTQISFTIGHTANVKLAVYDVLGREVATLLNRSMSAGRHQVSFLADDLPSGVYFYTLQAGDVSQTRKMVLMK